MADEGIYVSGDMDSIEEMVDKAVDSVESQERQREPVDRGEERRSHHSHSQQRDDGGRFSPPDSDDASGDADEMTAAHEYLAKQHGLDPNSFQKASDLEKHVEQLQAMRQAQQQQQRPIWPQQQQHPQQHFPQQFQPQQQQPRQLPQQWQPPEFKFQFPDGANMDPEDAKVLNQGLQQVGQYTTEILQRIVVPMAQQLQQQQQALQGFMQAQRQQQSQQFADEFDNAVNALENPQLFGKGKYNNLGMAHRSVRSRLYQTATLLASTMSQRGEQLPPMAELVKQAYQFEFPDAIRQEARHELTRQVRSRGASRPVSNKGRQSTRNPNEAWDGPPEDDPILVQKFKELQQEAEIRG